MEPLFENRSRQGEREQIAAFVYTSQKIKWMMTAMFVVMFAVIGGIWSASDPFIGISILVVGGLVTVLFFFTCDKSYVKAARRLAKTSAVLGANVEASYSFYETYMQECTAKNGEVISMSKLEYASLYRVVVFAEYWLIFISNAQAYVLEKSGTKNAAALEEFLERTLLFHGKKFIRSKKKLKIK